MLVYLHTSIISQFESICVFSERGHVLLSPLAVCMLSHSAVSNSLRLHGQPGSSVHGILQARILEWVARSTGDFAKPGIEPMPLLSPVLAGEFLTISTTWEVRRSGVPLSKVFRIENTLFFELSDKMLLYTLNKKLSNKQKT